MIVILLAQRCLAESMNQKRFGKSCGARAIPFVPFHSFVNSAPSSGIVQSRIYLAGQYLFLGGRYLVLDFYFGNLHFTITFELTTCRRL